MPQTTSLMPNVSIVPGVSILGVLSNLNYEPWFAFAEYVDNAIQSAAKSHASLLLEDPSYQLQVDIHYDAAGGGRIVIEDNAGGIDHADFPRAFKAAEVPPDRTGLSEFGMGMKSASIWFAKNWRVVTSSIGDPNAYAIEFDMTRVLADKVEQLQVSTLPVDSKSHFTRIELWNLNQRLPGRTLGKAREHLREIYRGFLRENALILTVAGQKMEYVEPQILMAQDYRAGEAEGISMDMQRWRKNIQFDLADGIHVEGWVAIRAEGKTSGNGLALFRRGRVILGSGETPYKPARIFGGGNSYRSQRLFGELEIKGLTVSHTKDGFQWHGYEEIFEERLRELLDAEPLPLLRQAENYRARRASRIELRRIQEATENTAAVAERRIPSALQSIRDEPQGPTIHPEKQSVDLASEPGEAAESFSRTFTFTHGTSQWSVLMTAADRPADSKWIIRQVEIEQSSGNVSIDLVLNTAHGFIKQFALGSTDSLEAIFRLSVALVVAESLAVTAGDGESAGTFMRQVDSLLSQALSKRLKDEA